MEEEIVDKINVMATTLKQVAIVQGNIIKELLELCENWSLELDKNK